MAKFKDMSTIKPLKVKGNGREALPPKSAPPEPKDGLARNAGEGRREFQFSGVTPPPKFPRGTHLRVYPKPGK